jgi:hypothetical protein
MEEVVNAHPAFPFFVAMACDGEEKKFPEQNKKPEFYKF